MTSYGNEGVGVQINYLKCAYRTKYYVVDKVNSKINAIHDDSLELTELKGHFSPFNLEELEMRVHKLADQNKDEDDLPEQQHAPQIQDSDSNTGSLSSKDTTGMGFDPNNSAPYHLLERQPHNNQGKHYQHQLLDPLEGLISIHQTQLTTGVRQI